MRRFIFASLRVVGALDQRLRERLTLAGWLVLGAAGSAAAAGLDTRLTVTYRAFAFLAALLVLCWIAVNVVLWSMKQSHDLLFLQSLVMTLIGYPPLYWYVICTSE